MPDYKELYLDLMRATEQAIRTLVEAQQDCEDKILYEEHYRNDETPSEP